jgi:chromosome segregation ATPase
MDDRKKQLDDLVRRRDSLKERKQRIQGKLEAARAELARIEAECREKKVEPEQLDSVISTLNKKLNEALEDLDKKMASSEAQLAPFLKIAD